MSYITVYESTIVVGRYTKICLYLVKLDARGPENDGRPRYGSRKVFFARLFAQLHSLPVPPLPSPEEQEAAAKPTKKAATKKKRSSSTSSTSSSRSNKKQKTSPNLLPSLPPFGAVVSEDSADHSSLQQLSF